MIPDTELRKGNKVLFVPQGKRHHHIKPRICTVMELQKLTALVDDMGLPLSLFYNSEDLQPVPISTEVLIAYGFEKHRNSNEFWTFWHLPNNWHIGEAHHTEPSAGVKKGLYYWGEEYLEVKYLHQLQNLYFAYTGKEITYNKS